MNLDSSHAWRWIWLVMGLVFACCELLAPATFFFLPFAIGALAAAFLGFLGAAVVATWLVFMVVSGVVFASLWKLGRKLERIDEEQEGVGATRWIGQEALVLKNIGPGDALGRVRLQREDWRAESLNGKFIAKESKVLITSLAGTRLVVVPVEEVVDHRPPTPTRSTGPAAV